MTTLLIIESNPRDQTFCRSALEGYKILFCESGQDALRKITEEGSSFGLVIALWELPGVVSGAEVLIHSRRVSPDLPVIMISAVWDLPRTNKALGLGAFDTLSKPLDKVRLQEAVARSLAAPAPPVAEMAALRERVVGASPNFLTCLERIAQVAKDPSMTVLLLAESGTGKGLLARSIHDLGTHPLAPWVAINISEIPANLLESKLFGHDRGAFTDAKEQRVGVFEECGSGTLFLDEIGELELKLQTKLLGVLQDRKFRRVGGKDDLTFSARLICATNRNLTQEVRAGRFREDLYHRIAQYEVRLPALRERPEDLWLLVRHFLESDAKDCNLKLARETKKLLSDYAFPGNVRQLRNILLQAVKRCKADKSNEILPCHLPLASMEELAPASSTKDDFMGFPWPDGIFTMSQADAVTQLERAFNREYLSRRLDEAGGNITKAAEVAGLDPKTFRRKWAEAGLTPLVLRK